MNRSLVLLAAVALLLPGCKVTNPEPPPGNPTVTAVSPAPSAGGTVRDARRITRDADRHNETARGELDTARGRVTDFREGDYRQLQNLVTRLRDNASATSDELQELYERVFAADGRIQLLLDRLQKIRDELASERELRREADEKLVDAQGEIATKDKEADDLRGQFEDMKATAADFESNSATNFKAALDAKGEADKEKGKTELLIYILVGVSILLLISLIFNYVQFCT